MKPSENLTSTLKNFGNQKVLIRITCKIDLSINKNSYKLNNNMSLRKPRFFFFGLLTNIVSFPMAKSMFFPIARRKLPMQILKMQHYITILRCATASSVFVFQILIYVLMSGL